MPVSPEFAESNRAQTARLEALVARLDERALATTLLNGWSVAVALAHVAFWDRQRLMLMRAWAAGIDCTGAYAGDVFNDAMQPLLEAIPAARAAALAVAAAREVDALLLELPDAVIEAALARPDRPNLDRGSHREHHLDQIEAALRNADSGVRNAD